MAARIRIVYLLLLIMSFGLVACSNESPDYRRGYEHGVEKGKEITRSESFAEGYSKGSADGYRKGFEQGRPGTPIKLSGVALTFYKLLVWGGALKVIGSLLFAAFALFRNSDSFAETAGKFIFSVFGATVTIVLVMYFSISDRVVNALLSPAPATLALQVVLLAIAGISMYVFLEVLFRLCSASRHRPKAEAWLLAIIASLISLLIPVLVVFGERVPEVTGYFGANLFAGSLLGGLYWLGSAALNRRFSPAEIVSK
jgi:hypothetical protein